VEPDPNNLPAPLSTFVARRGELDRLRELVDRTRLVTLTGPGGCGKTRLSQALARFLLRHEHGRFRDGIWLVELNAVSSDELVPQAVATALTDGAGLRATPRQPLLRSLQEHLAERSTLLLLDNCEQVVEGCRSMLQHLLRHCRHLHVVATSREGMALTGEQTYRVPGLSFPAEVNGAAVVDDLPRYEAIQLFVERAALARPGFTLSEGNAAPVGRICSALEGIPLAIELAAARVRSLPVGDVAERLFDVLDPQQVLESSIAASARMLTPPERALLGRLSVFTGGWTLEAAEAVCADHDDQKVRRQMVIDVLSRLVDRSLVLHEIRDDRARYHLLETVRQHADRHLIRSRDEAATRRRHLDCFAALAHEADSHFSDEQQVDWLNRLESEHGNLRSAERYALGPEIDPDIGAQMARDLHMFWYVRGYLDEGRAVLERIIARREGTEDVLQLQILSAAGTICTQANDVDGADRFYRSSLAIARTIGDRRREAGILTNLGILLGDHGRLEQGRRCHEQSIEAYRAVGDDIGVAAAQLNLSYVAWSTGALDETDTLVSACLPIFEHEGDVQRIAAAHKTIGMLEHSRGNLETAIGHLKQSLTIYRELGDRQAMASTLLWLGIVELARGHVGHVERLLVAADTVRKQWGGSWEDRDLVHYEQAVRSLRESTGGDPLQTSADAGSWTCDEMITWALQVD
jgi:non-specific serine/threonine protein kinase